MYKNIPAEKRYCIRCILDSTVPGIEFYSNGECSYCKLNDLLEEEYPLDSSNNINDLIDKIKKSGKGKKYDCIAGISGGTDSTYTLYLAKKFGLRVLAVHFDNGWNTELAVSNINNTLSKLGFDLFTYVVNWEEFKDLQLSFLKASTIDVEIPTDLAINGVLYRVALNEGLKYVLTGISFRTEGNMPQAWGYGDGKYMKSVQKLFGTKKLKTFPNITLLSMIYYNIIRQVKIVRFLNYFDYSKQTAAKILEKELGWRNYSGHHFESIYTRFFQGYISPVKFGVDRRIIALSAQVRSGHLSREEALKKISEKHYSDKEIEADKIYIAKKMGISFEEFENILDSPPRTFHDYKSNYNFLKRFQFVIRFLSRMKLIPMISHKSKYL
ncbi:MAG: N-acetyl sugar amidotransferase [Ignavibacteriaceae bacterium]|jgi:N-acetyl sugar amidotransferase